MNRLQYITRVFIFLLLATGLASCDLDRTAEMQSPTMATLSKEALGKVIFFDQQLSVPAGQACASCHAANTGFSDPDHRIVSEGAVAGLFGNRNAPSMSYMVFGPTLFFNSEDSVYTGGFFLDGRSATLQHQARQPFFNPLEMNNSSDASLAAIVKTRPWYKDFTALFGSSLSEQQIVDYMADAIAAFEQSGTLTPFNSKFDYYLKGEAMLSPQEQRGYQLFTDTAKGKCANCHVVEPDDEGRILFTDFTYDNLGTPRNTNNPFYGMSAQHNPAGSGYIDLGLGKFLNNPAENGKFKVPSLRNVAITAPYLHNGVFNTLEEVVHFYNKRDVDPFPAPEVAANVNKEELGNLKLTPQEEADIVAFLKTLTDGYR